MGWELVAVVVAVVLSVTAFRRLTHVHVPPGPRLFVSEDGQAQGAPPEPLILFGHLGRLDGMQFAQVISGSSTLSVVQIEDLPTLERWLAERESAGILAMSRTTAPGEAAQAIAAFLLTTTSGPGCSAAP